MDDNIVEVIPGIFGEIQPTGCTISTLSKNSRGYANKRLKIDGEWKTLTIHRLVLENSLDRPIRPEYFCCHSCDVRNCINPHHLWECSRLENSQNRFRKGRIKDVGSTAAPQPEKQLRGREVIPGILAEIQPNGSRICILAKRSDGYAIKGTKINGKTKIFYTDSYWKTNWEDRSNRVILRVTVATIAVVSIPTICGKEPPQITPAMPREKKPLSFRSRQDVSTACLKPEQVREIRLTVNS